MLDARSSCVANMAVDYDSVYDNCRIKKELMDGPDMVVFHQFH